MSVEKPRGDDDTLCYLTKEEEAENIQEENDEKSDPVEEKEVEAAEEEPAEVTEVKKEADASPVENETDKDENKAEDAPTTEATAEKQVEEVIEHPTEAPHPQAPKSSVLEPTSVLDTRDAQDPQERSKEFLELRSYEAKRRSIYLSKMKSTALYWKAYVQIIRRD